MVYKTNGDSFRSFVPRLVGREWYQTDVVTFDQSPISATGGIKIEAKQVASLAGYQIGAGSLDIKNFFFQDEVKFYSEPTNPFAMGLNALLTARDRIEEEIEALDRQLMSLAKEDDTCRRLMTIPSVGPLAAVTFTSVIDDPGRFKTAAQIGNYLGLAPRQYQSSNTETAGRITKTGDTALRALLYECANVLIGVVKKPCRLQSWALKLKDRVGHKKARTALARKLAILMHKLWLTGQPFDWQAA